MEENSPTSSPNPSRKLRPSPSLPPQPSKKEVIIDPDYTGSQSVPDIRKYFTFYNNPDAPEGGDLNEGYQLINHHIEDDAVTIAETETVNVARGARDESEQPTLPMWKEMLIILAVLVVPLLAMFTTYILNHYLPLHFEVLK